MVSSLSFGDLASRRWPITCVPALLQGCHLPQRAVDMLCQGEMRGQEVTHGNQRGLAGW